MSSTFPCPSCRRLVLARDDVAGLDVQCPACGEVFVGPAAGRTTAAAARQAIPAPPRGLAPREVPPAADRPAPGAARRPGVGPDPGPDRHDRRRYAPDWDDDEPSPYAQPPAADRPDPDDFRRLYSAALGCYVGAPVAYLAGSAYLTADDERRGGVLPDFVIFVVTLAMCLLAVLAVVLFLRLLYKAWKLVQDGHAPTTPGLAVGLQFLPVFSLYWNFVAYPGLIGAMGRYALRHRLPPVGLTSAPAVAYCVAVIAVFIPCDLRALAALAAYIVYPIMMNTIKDGAAALASAKAGRRFRD